MEFRSPTFNAFGTIDCEINHPLWGWIPFTCDPQDAGAEFDTAALFEAMAPSAAEHAPPPPRHISATDIRRERDRRLRLDFEFQGVMYQRDPISVQRIAGAAQIATMAIAQGAQPGDMFWHGGDAPFGWIASDDTVTLMDAQTVVAFGMAAAALETALIFAARHLRNMQPIPSDYANDKWWP
jgi:hypothetical protein